MKTISNEEKARDLCMTIEPPYIDFIQQNYKTALEAMEWKDKQFKIVVSKLLKKLAKYDMLDATLCASGLLNLSKQDAQQYIKTL